MIRCLALALTLVACGPTRSALLTVTPGVPAESHCPPGAYACDGDVPTLCSASGRAWPVLPRDASGVQTHCPHGCTMAPAGIAHCGSGQ